MPPKWKSGLLTWGGTGLPPKPEEIVIPKVEVMDAGDTEFLKGEAVEALDLAGDQADEFNRQRTKLIEALKGIGADVQGLNELENTPGVDPLGDPTRVRLLHAVSTAPAGHIRIGDLVELFAKIRADAGREESVIQPLQLPG